MDFDNKLQNILNKMNNHMATYYRECDVFSDDADTWIERSTYTTSVGRKYVKIIREGAVVAFIDRNTGDIFKPATWQAPAKGVRGNLFSAHDGMEALNFSSNGLVFVYYARGY